MQTDTEIKQNFVEKTEYVNRASPKYQIIAIP